MFSGDLSKAPLRLRPCGDAERVLTLMKTCAVREGTMEGELELLPVTNPAHPLSCHCSEYSPWVPLCTTQRADVRLNVWAVAESNTDWHVCLVPVHSKVQFISKFLMFFCIAHLEKLSFEGELSCWDSVEPLHVHGRAWHTENKNKIVRAECWIQVCGLVENPTTFTHS